jgi:hypothetical protein
MPAEMMTDDKPGSRAFQPMLPPNHPAFEEAMQVDLFDILVSRQMHSEHHNPTCFKYGKGRNCRFRVASSLRVRAQLAEGETASHGHRGLDFMYGGDCYIQT